MPRIRSVHPDICVSETMAELPAELERTFVRLWTHCDDHGRCLDNVKLLKAGLYPLHDTITAKVLDQQLDQLHETGLVLRYSVNGTRYLCVPSWNEYQHPQRPTPSKYPEPDGDVKQGGDTPPRVVDEGSRTGGEKEIGEGEGVGGPAVGGRKHALKDDWEPSRLSLRWAESDFPTIDLRTETLKFRDHAKANARKCADWDAAWKNWIRKAAEFQTKTPTNRGSGPYQNPSEADYAEATI